jgi:hypothetical protein
MFRVLLILSFIFSISNASFIKPLLQIGFTGGGDELVTIEHEYSRNYTIDAGDSFFIEAGMAIENPVTNFETQLFVGYKFDTDTAGNGDITWDAIPITALGLFNFQGWKFGGGITYHISPELSGDFAGDLHIRDEFEDAIGGIIQVQYEIAKVFSIGLRGTFIEYQLKRDNNQKANGNSLGVVATIKFGGSSYRYR